MIMITLMVGVLLLILVVAVLVLLRRRNEQTGATPHDVFRVDDTELVILSGIPMTYKLHDIQEVVLSLKYAHGYKGTIQIIKINGRRSRKFIFDSSSLKNKFAWSNSKQDIQDTIHFLADILESYGIPCTLKL